MDTDAKRGFPWPENCTDSIGIPQRLGYIGVIWGYVGFRASPKFGMQILVVPIVGMIVYWGL